MAFQAFAYGGAVTLRVCDIITLMGLENFPSHVYLSSARIQIIRLQGTWIMNFQASCILIDPIDHFLIIQCKSRRWWVLVSKILCSPKFALFDFFINNLSRFSAQNNLLCHVRLLAASTQFLSLFLSFKLTPTTSNGQVSNNENQSCQIPWEVRMPFCCCSY